MTAKAYGCTTWWGFSPAKDLVEVLSQHEVEHSSKSEFNFLLVGAGDGRHILQTIAKLRNINKKLNFYVVENDLETVARQLLLINLIVEPISEYGLQEKCELFMELYGNSLIRESAENYLCKKSNQFIKWVTGDEQMPGIFSVSNLKFKERDQLEGIFKFWRNQDRRILNMQELWDFRCREYLSNRYDTRENTFDWNYSMQLKGRAPIVSWHEYKRWRETGIAFQLRDETTYEISNKTLTSGVISKKSGECISKRGYWGDILVSPYISFGSESHEMSLFKVNNNVHVKTATDVTRFNIASNIHEIHYAFPYTEVESSETSGPVITEVAAESDQNDECSTRNHNFSVYFLSPSSVTDLSKKSKFQHQFDLISFSNSMVHLLDSSISHLFAQDALLMIESTKFTLDISEDLQTEYGKKITRMAHAAKCKEIKTFEAMEHAFAVFKFDCA